MASAEILAAVRDYCEAENRQRLSSPHYLADGDDRMTMPHFDWNFDAAGEHMYGAKYGANSDAYTHDIDMRNNATRAVATYIVLLNVERCTHARVRAEFASLGEPERVQFKRWMFWCASAAHHIPALVAATGGVRQTFAPLTAAGIDWDRKQLSIPLTWQRFVAARLSASALSPEEATSLRALLVDVGIHYAQWTGETGAIAPGVTIPPSSTGLIPELKTTPVSESGAGPSAEMQHLAFVRSLYSGAALADAPRTRTSADTWRRAVHVHPELMATHVEPEQNPLKLHWINQEAIRAVALFMYRWGTPRSVDATVGGHVAWCDVPHVPTASDRHLPVDLPFEQYHCVDVTDTARPHDHPIPHVDFIKYTVFVASSSRDTNTSRRADAPSSIEQLVAARAAREPMRDARSRLVGEVVQLSDDIGVERLGADATLVSVNCHFENSPNATLALAHVMLMGGSLHGGARPLDLKQAQEVLHVTRVHRAATREALLLEQKLALGEAVHTAEFGTMSAAAAAAEPKFAHFLAHMRNGARA